jgi:hypothetical protein
MSIDYYELNQFIIKNQYPLPSILRLLDQLNHAKVYIKIYLYEAYIITKVRCNLLA